MLERFQIFDGDFVKMTLKNGDTVEGYYRLEGDQVQLRKERRNTDPVFATYSVSDIEKADFRLYRPDPNDKEEEDTIL